MQGKNNASKNRVEEFTFLPRVINPVRIKFAVFFCAEERVRDAKRTLEKEMPWIVTEVFSNPLSLLDYRPQEKASVFIFDDTALNLIDAQMIRQNIEDAVLILLTSNGLIQCSPPSVAQAKFPYSAKADLVFAYNNADCAPDQIITSVVRAAEDLLNITKYSKAKRFIFLIVDDEPRWFSQFLPVLYNIIGQRADVMLARTFEESLEFIFGVRKESEIDEKGKSSLARGDDIVCLITDIFFPKGDDLMSAAGKDLVKLISKYYSRIPIVVASKTKEADAFLDIAFVLPKGDPGSLETLRKYIRDYTGIGEFIIFNRQGDELFRLKNISEMLDVLDKADKDSKEANELREILESYGENDKFSTWLYMHSHRDLADELRPQRIYGQQLIDVLKKSLRAEMQRAKYTPLIIDGVKVFDLEALINLIRSIDPSKMQEYSDNDLISSWLDRKGYTELAEELRPIHGSGEKLANDIADFVRKWIKKYRAAGYRG
jgi:hypothetical protein